MFVASISHFMVQSQITDVYSTSHDITCSFHSSWITKIWDFPGEAHEIPSFGENIHLCALLGLRQMLLAASRGSSTSNGEANGEARARNTWRFIAGNIIGTWKNMGKSSSESVLARNTSDKVSEIRPNGMTSPCFYHSYLGKGHELWTLMFPMNKLISIILVGILVSIVVSIPQLIINRGLVTTAHSAQPW